MGQFEKLRNHIAALTLLFIIIIYTAFYMGEQGTWWSGATILIAIIVAIGIIIHIITSSVAFYDVIAGDSKGWRIKTLEEENNKLEGKIQSYRAELAKPKEDIKRS